MTKLETPKLGPMASLQHGRTGNSVVSQLEFSGFVLVCRHRHRRRDRVDPRLCPPAFLDHRQFLGRYDLGLALCALLPICVAATLFLVWRGIPQTLGATVGAAALDGGRQLIARGPAASQIAIKLLSGDGGGFFNANSAHPFENPTAEANLVEMLLRLCDRRRPDQMTMLAILCIPIVIVPRSAGTLPTNRILFVLLLLGVIVVVGGLTFLPALSLGPAAEQLAMRTGHLY